MSTHIPVQKIKHCPKCQSREVFCEQNLEEEPRYFVICNGCGHEGQEMVKRQHAIAIWNNPPQVKAACQYKDY